MQAAPLLVGIIVGIVVLGVALPLAACLLFKGRRTRTARRVQVRRRHARGAFWGVPCKWHDSTASRLQQQNNFQGNIRVAHG
jgi:hypothetical protein